MLLPWIVVVTFLGAALAVHPFERRIADVNDPIFRDDGINYRLPNDTHPESYKIALKTRVDIAQFDYSGAVKIGIIVDEPTRSVVLHKRDLTVVRVSLSRYNRTGHLNSVDILPYGYDLRTDFLTITTNGIELIPHDRLVLDIRYVSSLATKSRGFYRTSYTNSDDSKRWLAATHFVPTGARTAFPCYDEPAFKAKFTIQITHGKGYHALSNMPETRVEHSDDTATTVFDKTPLMSTYLIAFVVSDFEHKTNTDTPGVFRHRVYAQPAKVDSAELAVNEGVRILSAFEKYLQVKFSLPKMDQVAVPAAGRAENWGLVVCNEDFLLWNQQTDPLTDTFNVVGTIAHQFAHQWFGNLVSPQFWQFVWLNEGFANLFGFIGADLVHPEWNIFHIFVTSGMQYTLDWEASPSARPMSFYTENTEAIERLFDRVVIVKSGCVLRMFMNAFTESTFKKGLRYYLAANAYKAVEDGDLFNALDKAAKEDRTLDAGYNVGEILSSWSNQPGYPLITVQREYKDDNTSDAFVLTQHHYMSAKTWEDDTAAWWVPFNYATSSSPNFNDTRATGWIRQNEKVHALNVSLSASEWIILNKQQSSLYRVLYDEYNYRLIAEQLNSDKFGDIHVLSRSQLLHDLFEFVKVGRVKIDILFEFLAYLKHETEYAPWRPAEPALLWLEHLLGGSEHFIPYRSFVAQLTKKYYESTGTEEVAGETMTNRVYRNRASSLACRYRLEACLEATRKQLAESLQSGSALPSDSAQIVYNHGSRTASEPELERLWKRFFDVTDADVAEYIASGFGLIEEREFLEKYLKRTLHAYPREPAHRQWRYTMIVRALNNGPDSLLTCIRFLRSAAPDFDKFLESNEMAHIISLIASRNMYPDTQIEFEDALNYLVDGGYISGAVAAKAREDMKIHENEFNAHHKLFDEWISHRDDFNSASSLYLATLLYYLFAIVMLLLLVE